MKSVADVMRENKTDLSRVEPNSSVYDAIRIMSERDLGALLVMEGETLIGVLSERDYTRKVTLRDRDVKKTKVKEIMSRELVLVTPQHSLDECMKLMSMHQVRHIPVVGPENHVVGFISILDVAHSLLHQHVQQIRHLEKYVSETWPF